MMTSKERLLSAIRSEPVDHVPMTIRFWMWPKHARVTWQNDRERLAYFAQRGWDAAVDLWCGLRPTAEVRGEVFHEQDSGGPVLRQVWHTPAGDIHERLRVTDDWPEAQQATQCVGLLNDFRPSRYLEVPFKTMADLDALPYLLPVESPSDEESLVNACRAGRALANEFKVPLFVDIRPGLDWLVWLFPAEEAVMRAVDEPDMVAKILTHIAAAYHRRLDVLLDAGIDAIVRSGWYESADLWSPDLFRTLAVPVLEKEISKARAAGVAMVYLMDSGVKPMLPDLNRLGFDCLAGVDPATAGGCDLAGIRAGLPGKAMWGGISGPLHLGRGTQAQVEQAVERAFAACGRRGFILGPVVGFRHDWPWENLDACERAWRRLR